MEQLTGWMSLDPGHAMVTVTGRLGDASMRQFRALLDAAISVAQPKITVNVVGLDNIDAAGVDILVAAAQHARASGAKLTVLTEPGAVDRVLRLTELTVVLGAEQVDDDTRLFPGLIADASVPQARDVLDAALKLVVTMAAAVVSGADGVSITLPRQGSLRTVAASNEVVLGMDHDQYNTGEGPCLSAAVDGERFYIEALRHEDRWPQFVPLARARGIESILSTPLREAETPLGALNIYSRTAGGLAPHEVEWADLFASEASTVLCRAQQGADASALSSELQGALLSRETIALAQGVVMERQGISATAAYVTLILTSRRTSQPLREVCQEVLSAADHTRPPPPSPA